MEKKYKKILNDQGRIEYVEDINGRYTEKDFEGEFVLKGNVQKSEELINKEKETKSKNIIYFVVALVFVLIVVLMDNPSDPDDYYRYTEEEEDCYRIYQQNYQQPPTADELKANPLLMSCLERARS